MHLLEKMTEKVGFIWFVLNKIKKTRNCREFCSDLSRGLKRLTFLVSFEMRVFKFVFYRFTIPDCRTISLPVEK